MGTIAKPTAQLLRETIDRREYIVQHDSCSCLWQAVASPEHTKAAMLARAAPSPVLDEQAGIGGRDIEADRGPRRDVQK